jgi:hypothetical protein
MPSLTRHLGEIEKDAQQYKRWDRCAAVHKRWVEKPHTLTEAETDLLMSMHYEEPIRLDRPSPLILVDDMSHSDIYSPSRSNSFIDLCLRHRHVSGIGVTLFMLVQTFKTG